MHIAVMGTSFSVSDLANEAFGERNFACVDNDAPDANQAKQGLFRQRSSSYAIPKPLRQMHDAVMGISLSVSDLPSGTSGERNFACVDNDSTLDSIDANQGKYFDGRTIIMALSDSD